MKKAPILKTAKGILLSLCIVILSAGFSQAQVPELINIPEFRVAAKTAVDSIYNFNFDGAEHIFRPWKEQYPDHPLWVLMEGISFWWQVLSDLSVTSHDEQFFHMMKRADYESSRLLRKDHSHIDGLIIKVVSNGYIARHYANRDEWLNSLNRARRALSAYQYLLELKPRLADLKLAEGLKLYYSAYLPEAYPIVNTVSWFLPDGDKQKGLALMKEAAQNAIFARAEATYFLGNINYNYEENYDKATHYFENLYRTYPRNNYYARLLVKSYYRLHRYDLALEIINRSLERWEEEDLPYEKVLDEELLTWRGRILMKRGQFHQATASFKEAFETGKALPRTKHRPFHVMSGYYLGRTLYNQREYAEAKTYLEQVKDCKTGDKYRDMAAEMLADIRALE